MNFSQGTINSMDQSNKLQYGIDGFLKFIRFS